MREWSFNYDCSINSYKFYSLLNSDNLYNTRFYSRAFLENYQLRKEEYNSMSADFFKETLYLLLPKFKGVK